MKAFAQALEDLGYVHSILEAQENVRCCDFSFRLRVEAYDPQGDLLHA